MYKMILKEAKTTSPKANKDTKGFLSAKSVSTLPHSLRMSLLTLSATSKSQPSSARCRTPNQSVGLSWMVK